MTDREMLDLAAKAAGASDYGSVEAGWEGFLCLRVAWDDGFEYEDWNPLTVDGDALRLAVRLGMMVDVRYGKNDGRECLVSVSYWPFGYHDTALVICERSFDQLTATRRAITRAAAEIGRAMPCSPSS